MTVLIPLTKGLSTYIDDVDAERVCACKWHVISNKNGAVYAATRIGTKAALLHKFIMPSPRGMVTDHKDRDTLNNRRSNLRLATYSQNSANRVTHLGKSKFKGVVMRTGRSISAAITVRGKRIEVGPFGSELEAAKAYDRLAIEHFGEFAFLNIPENAQELSTFA